jgi:hypothetical protein
VTAPLLEPGSRLYVTLDPARFMFLLQANFRLIFAMTEYRGTPEANQMF